MRSSESVTITVRLDRGLWSRLRHVAEHEPDQSGRASVSNIIRRSLESKFSEAGAGSTASGAKAG